MAKVAAAKQEESKAVSIADVTIDKAPQIFGVNNLSQFVAAVRAEVIGEVPDLTTDKGRKRIGSLAATVARSKTAVDGVGRAYLKKLKEMPKVIEAELRDFETQMNALRDEVRKPLNEYEAKEQARKDAIENAVQAIVDLFTAAPDESCEQLENRLTFLEAVVINADNYQERLEEADEKRNYGVAEITKALIKRKVFEDEQAELERLRKEAAERAEQDRIRAAKEQAVQEERQRAERAQQEERDRLAREQQAQRDEDARKLRESEERVQRAEQGRLAVERQAEQDRQQAAQREQQARQEEQQRQQREQRAIEIAREAREADTAHRGSVNKAALEALIAVNVSADGQPESFISATEARAIIIAIVRGQIPNVSIAY